MITATIKDHPKRYAHMKVLIQNALINPDFHARVLLQHDDVLLFIIDSDAGRRMLFYQSDQIIGYSQITSPRGEV